MSADPPTGARRASGPTGPTEVSAAGSASGRENREILREIRRRAAALARDLWGRGPERCEAHWAGPDLLLIVFHGGLTAAETNLKRAGDFGEVERSRSNFRRAIEPPLQRLTEALTARTVRGTLGASRLDPDLTLEAFLFARDAGDLTDRLHSAELDSREAWRTAADELESASALHEEATQARRLARDRRHERDAHCERPPDQDAMGVMDDRCKNSDLVLASARAEASSSPPSPE